MENIAKELDYELNQAWTLKNILDTQKHESNQWNGWKIVRIQALNIHTLPWRIIVFLLWDVARKLNQIK